ncbi:hypothetical protein N9D31_03980 [Oligoflexaceae bacterium]|nr:hypothetical protein [Oligoflexaceae bacterium]
MIRVASILIAFAVAGCSDEKPRKTTAAQPAAVDPGENAANQIPQQSVDPGDSFIGDINSQKADAEQAGPLAAIINLLGPLLGQSADGQASPLSGLLQSFMGGTQGSVDPSALNSLDPQLLSQLTGLLSQQGEGGLDLQSLLATLPSLNTQSSATGLVSMADYKMISLASLSGALPQSQSVAIDCVGDKTQAYGVLAVRLKQGEQQRYGAKVLDCDDFKLSAIHLNDGVYKLEASFKGHDGSESQTSSELTVKNGAFTSGGL